MRLLLDANVLIWALYEPERLTPALAALLEEPSNLLLLSHATLWEILAKVGRRRLLLAGTSVDKVLQRISAMGVTFLPMTTALIVAASTLPHHHSDPFDRRLIAQALAEDAAILSADRMLLPYGVDVIWNETPTTPID